MFTAMIRGFYAVMLENRVSDVVSHQLAQPAISAYGHVLREG